MVYSSAFLSHNVCKSMQDVYEAHRLSKFASYCSSGGAPGPLDPLPITPHPTMPDVQQKATYLDQVW